MVEKKVEGSGETKLETGVSYVLITGVVVSFILEVTGMVLYYKAFHSMAIERGSTISFQGSDFFAFLRSVLLKPSTQSPSVRLMILGIAVLILTPYARAILSVAYFAVTRNVKYVVITLFVLVILTISLMMH